MAKDGFSRRKVIGAGAALAASGLVGACSQSATRDEGAYRGGSHLYDAIVIGAGLAGLHAARILEKQGLDVLTIEGRDRVGGRVYTLMDVPGNPEAGGEWIGSNYARMLTTAKELGLKLVTRDQFTSFRADTKDRANWAEKFYIIKGEGIRQEDWEGHRLNPMKGDDRTLLPDRMLFDLSHRNNPLSGQPLDAWADPKYSQFDIPHSEYLRTYVGLNDETIRLMNVMIHAEHIDTTSALNELRRYAVGEFNTNMAKARNEPSGWQIEGGNSRITRAMADTLRNGVLLEKTVHTIDDQTNEVIVECTDGSSYRAKKVVNSMPMTLMRDVKFSKRLSPKWADAINEMTYGISMQMHFEIERPFWEDDGLPAQMWSDSAFERFAVLQNGPDGAYSSAVVFVNGVDSYRYQFMDDDQVMQYTLAMLEKARPSTVGALKPIRIQSCHRDRHGAGDWMIWKPGQVNKFATSLRDPEGNIHFAGEHTALLERGMEGAFESGERAAFDLLSQA